MKLVCISDTHGLHKKVSLPDGDILVCSGDVSGSGRIEEIIRFADWIKTLLSRGKFKHVVWTAGNHDILAEENPTLFRSLIAGAGHYLEQSSVTIDGIKFFGSPYTPEFFDWAFNLKRGDALRTKWNQIPTDTDVLITHGPPYKILDEIMRKTRTHYDDPTLEAGHVGCADLLEAVKRVKPQVHCFGHIHESRGLIELDGTCFVNASICTLSYEPTNKPIVIEISPRGETDITASS